MEKAPGESVDRNMSRAIKEELLAKRQAHCGASLAGEFIWSLTCTDMASAWTAGRAVCNKGAAGPGTPSDGCLRIS